MTACHGARCFRSPSAVFRLSPSSTRPTTSAAATKACAREGPAETAERDMLLKVTGVTAHYRQGAVTRATRSNFETLARRKRKSSEKLGRRQLLSSGALQLGDKEGAFSAGNEHAAWVYVQHFARYPSPWNSSAPPDLQLHSAQAHAHAGRRIEGANAAADCDRALTPVYARLAPVELRGIRHPFGGLGARSEPARFELAQGAHDEVRAKPREPVVQGTRGVVLQDRNPFLQQHRPCVEPGVHLHDGYTGFPIPREKRPLYGRRAAPARQEGCVNVDRTVAGDLEHRPRQNQPVGDDDHDVGPSVFELLV